MSTMELDKRITELKELEQLEKGLQKKINTIKKN